MQTSQYEISAQQLVLAFLGFYGGVIDGIWSSATIDAMKAFERDDSFCPAVPTNGLPFAVNSKLPKGMYWDKKIVNHRKLTPERAAELLKKHVKAARPVEAAPVVQVEKQAPAKVTSPVKTEAVENAPE